MNGMTSAIGTFPFGEPVRVLQQQDRGPKKVFVLGVYASAVHATWLGPGGERVVEALAVASEPYIFWRGEDAGSIISRVRIPQEVGALVPARPQLNGPSGLALDKHYLMPLTLTREDVWLCDVVPHSCVNPDQQRAIDREYIPRAQQYALPVPSVPIRPKRFNDSARRRAIVTELRESQAQLLILLGDEPIKWFLKSYAPRWGCLADFGRSSDEYGRLHRVSIDGLPLVHPRQAARLGSYSKDWNQRHNRWLSRVEHHGIASL